MEYSSEIHSDNENMERQLHKCKCNHACHLRDYAQRTKPDINLSKNMSPTINGTQLGLQLPPTSSKLRVQNGLLDLGGGSRLWSRSRSRSRDWRHWVRNNLLLLVVMAMLSVTMVMPAYWHFKMAANRPESTQDTSKTFTGSDAKLRRIMRSLQAAHVEANHREVQERNATKSTLIKFPWIAQNNTLGNYFLGGSTRHGEDSYRHSNGVFLHHHRTAGSAMSECLTDLSSLENLRNPHKWDSSARSLWDKKVKFREKRSIGPSSSTLDSIQLHTGQYSFGICDLYSDQKCSYFMLLRDPMDRAVSSYHYCQQVGLRGDLEWCRVVDANEVTLRDWILLHGSLTFQQFLYNATWCDSEELGSSRYLLSGTSVEVPPSEQWPCWLKQRIRFEHMQKEDREHLLEYVLDNMESWFSVVGFVDQIDKSLAMFEHVYGLPFTKCKSFKSLTENALENEDNHSNRNNAKRGYYDDNDPEYLQYDYFVRKALEADYKIFKKAKQIFNVQKQMLFNML